MGLYRTRAIALRSIDLSETDKIVTFFTERHGKVKCVAKGARKIKTRFAASLEPMSYLHLIYFGKENQELYRLNHADILESFQSIREDFHKLYTGIYFNELVDAMVSEGQREPEIFQLLLDSLWTLKGRRPLDTLVRLFELRFLALSGYAPQLDRCTVCKGVPRNGSAEMAFSYPKKGIVCSDCRGTVAADARLPWGTLNYLKKLLRMEVQFAGRLKIPKGVEDDLEALTHRLVLVHLGRELKSYPFIKKMAALA